MHYSYPPEVQLALVSLRMFENWRDLVGEEGDFRKTGFVRIVHPGETERLKQNVEMQRKLGVNVKLIDRVELKELEPDWTVDEVELAAYEPDSGYGDGAGVANDFSPGPGNWASPTSRRPRPLEFLVEGGRVRGVSTDHGEIAAPVVVAATGPWTRPLFQQHRDRTADRNRVPPGRDPEKRSRHEGRRLRLHRFGQRHLLPLRRAGQISDRRFLRPARRRSGQFSAARIRRWLEEIIERASRRIPKLENAEVMRGVTGVYDMTPDSRPLLGEISGVAGLYVCAGFSGMGFKISPAIGLVMSELLLDGRGKTVDISSFCPGRFAAGKPIKAEFEYKDD